MRRPVRSWRKLTPLPGGFVGQPTENLLAKAVMPTAFRPWRSASFPPLSNLTGLPTIPGALSPQARATLARRAGGETGELPAAGSGHPVGSLSRMRDRRDERTALADHVCTGWNRTCDPQRGVRVLTRTCRCVAVRRPSAPASTTASREALAAQGALGAPSSWRRLGRSNRIGLRQSNRMETSMRLPILATLFIAATLFGENRAASALLCHP
jgi:hypothetical protein